MKTPKLLLLASILLMVSCAPASKEKYLQRFDEFIQEVSDNKDSYTEEDWTRVAEKYDKFCGEWYDKFEKEFTLLEKGHIVANEGKWLYYQNLSGVISDLDKAIQSIDTDKIKKDVKFYLENDMQKDLQNLYDTAVEKGKEAEQAILEIFEELEINIEEYK